MESLYILLAWVVGIILVLFCGKALKVPFKLALKLLFNSLLGGMVIIVINFFGQFINFHISLNFFSALIVGTLGLPGVILLIILKFML
ncbi:pro-sigmaK processing inhibitor BofA [Thermoclostridium stercorarium subsp. stercorarium DSM 8532]|jgi:inhibitor of the pro-sigma K processing machinery|uniref:Pro-sigmaK processing inhibitor BofA n=3 Tax=Thermoclostridium stercorarium TaxID=1510 RepID=L7VGR3_THES1|nr:pro-sigmaK processing inhibitor BofA family protein [Thermoclostridium stercorarium]AGC67140.1 pro-sigmaK processing inhibitor BofA [Thermoclostridium stercorarium subsp. stercorarium DSM 8532]AGI38218.1 BofA [Thermoclostridium stercorarium subsp. stercorarium DSM 8532]ANW97623.1 SigmaK-factor processing regulatory BofA [Thermoclostridium stercorarium subsp. thermolacticum DSM 2910]ANX00183.1 SigmaK-factor processing regulatory BofA [Thermoclostridium stercorarium subsp. leptospartum DSM 921